MGIMHKVLRHRQAVSRMDLTIRKCPSDSSSDSSSSSSSNSSSGSPCPSALSTVTNSPLKDDVDEEGTFTAEHILQLCKFLAEKSKRTKNLYSRLASPQQDENICSPALRQTSTIDTEMLDVPETEIAKLLPYCSVLTHPEQSSEQLLQCTANTTPPLISERGNPRKIQFNSDTQLPTAKVKGISMSGHCSFGQGKRDILLKIRRQIFERKRLRQMAHMQQDLHVWRPW